VTVNRVEALRDASGRLLAFSRGDLPLHPDEKAVYVAIGAIRTCLGADAGEAEAADAANDGARDGACCQAETTEPVYAGGYVPVYVDRWVVGEGATMVLIKWFGTGWEITAPDFMRDLHLYVAADDRNHTVLAFDRARELEAELHRITDLRRQATDAEEALRMQDEPF
jgi:hypothetical protein